MPITSLSAARPLLPHLVQSQGAGRPSKQRPQQEGQQAGPQLQVYSQSTYSLVNFLALSHCHAAA